jgi:hypothetical protein
MTDGDRILQTYLPSNVTVFGYHPLIVRPFNKLFGVVVNCVLARDQRNFQVARRNDAAQAVHTSFVVEPLVGVVSNRTVFPPPCREGAPSTVLSRALH